MRAGLLWAVLLVLACAWLAPDRAGATGLATSAWAAPGAAAAPHAAVRRHHRAHIVRVHHRHHRRPASAQLARSEPAQDAAAVPAEVAPTTPAACADLQAAADCQQVAAARHALAMAHRRAIAAGVPAPVLRVGYDAWAARRAAAAQRSDAAVVDAYRARLAFVREAVALKPDFGSIFPPAAPQQA